MTQSKQHSYGDWANVPKENTKSPGTSSIKKKHFKYKQNL